MTVNNNSLSPREVLNKYWGYDAFRPLQEDIIQSVLEGRDTLGLMPTGGGKSITFQVPGLMLGGLTIVVTPLISLMKDQVDNLAKIHVKAVFLHSGMTAKESRIAWEKLVNGKAKFLYCSPERLRNERFINELRYLHVSLIVVDEAHCISQWGYDFRPSYLNISILRKAIPNVPVLALTATATPPVAQDICEKLLFHQGFRQFKKSFSRENISYIVRPSEMKINDIFHILTHTQGASIVYVRSRKRTRDISDYLRQAGISATYYHAGLDYEEKEIRQNAWQTGEIRVMVATNAFGMGIDKPDVRVVIHYDIPPSLEEYYQEAGRAGRDGLPSYAVLLPSKHDVATMRRHVTEAFPERSYILKIYERTCNYLNIAVGEGYDLIKDFDLDKFCNTFSLQPRQCRSALNILSRAGYLDYIEETDSQSRVIIPVTREELYHISDISENADKVLNALLRNYPGLFIDYVYISENLLVRETALDSQLVYEALLELSRRKIVNYMPRSRMPIMHIPTSREEVKYVIIGKNVYEDRKKVMKERTEAMLDYVYNSGSCRVDRMLNYFGEKDSGRCGSCDVCRGRKIKDKKKTNLSPEVIVAEFKNSAGGMSYKILEAKLEHRGLKVDRGELSSLLTFLCSEGFMTCREGMYYLSENV